MTISNWTRYAAGVTVTAAMLAACSGTQPQLGAPSPVQQNATQSVSAPTLGHVPVFFGAASGAGNRTSSGQPNHEQSWMAPDAKKRDLLYISDIGASAVYAYSYPKGKLEGTLTDLGGASGMCSDLNCIT
jgi:hypothetical protein